MWSKETISGVFTDKTAHEPWRLTIKLLHKNVTNIHYVSFELHCHPNLIWRHIWQKNKKSWLFATIYDKNMAQTICKIIDNEGVKLNVKHHDITDSRRNIGAILHVYLKGEYGLNLLSIYSRAFSYHMLTFHINSPN